MEIKNLLLSLFLLLSISNIAFAVSFFFFLTFRTNIIKSHINCFVFYVNLLEHDNKQDDSDDCVYTVYIRTGSIFKGGTDSIIGMTLYDAVGDGVRISNLEAWGGLMGPGYNYFERGNLDIFSGRGPCLGGPVCALNLSSDGSGEHHGWYCNYVEVTSTGVHTRCAQQQFTIEQWLATDTSPYELSVFQNYCDYVSSGQRRERVVKSKPLASTM